jgi:uncharacterized membrane protein
MTTPPPLYADAHYSEGGAITAIVFADEEQATSLLRDVQKLEKQGVIELEDAVVVVKNQKGKAKITETTDKSTKKGTGLGGMLGLFLGLMAGGPVGGLAVGLLGGRLVGKMVDIGVDEKFIKEVTNALEPGNSAALFQVKASHNPRLVRETLTKYHGKVYSTAVDESVAKELQRMLDE